MFLGVDGGGSKTALVLIDREGSIRATHLTSGAYYLSLGLDGLADLISAAVSVLLAKATVRASDVSFAFLGLPAYGEDRAASAEMDRLPERCLRPGSFLCGNDMVCGWAGSLACADGINVVAGTGSICYGERLGSSARCGGWGELFSDEGSAYWIAARGLALFARQSDGRAARGPLYSLMRDAARLNDDLDLCAHVYVTLGSDRARIAELCPVVFEAAERGDAGARGILDEAATELATMVDSTRVRLGFPVDEIVEVSYSGGVFRGAGARVLKHLAKALETRSRYRLREPAFPPVVGAALYAAKRFGQALGEPALARLRAVQATT